jgi:hypothetical protein
MHAGRLGTPARAAALLFLATLCLLACGKSERGGAASGRAGASSAGRLDAVAVSNAEYTIPVAAAGTVRTQGGNWSDPQGRQSLTVFDMNARGDLNGDGVPDAAVVLVYWGGGSGVFNYLAAVVNEQGQPRHVASAELGDRVRIDGISIKDGTVTVNLVVQGANDPMCCPTQAATRSFSLRGQELVETGKEAR